MAKRYLERKLPVFTALPRRKQRDAVIALKGQMRREVSHYGGMFTSELILSEAGRPALYCQWFDFYFPGLNPRILWNATIVTAREQFWDESRELAHTQLRDAISEVELYREDCSIHWVPADIGPTKCAQVLLPNRPDAQRH
jgi:hypothetical protein